MMPLWTTASRGEACGWALVSVGLPWVAQRVWPMPIAPMSGSAASLASRFFSFPSARRRASLPFSSVATPAEVVATVFEALQRVDDGACNRPRPEHTHDSAHRQNSRPDPIPMKQGLGQGQAVSQVTSGEAGHVG